MSDTIKETSPMLTPDGLRKTLQFLSNYYDTHTKKNFGREDINGSQYSGTVENFGFEMLTEARKIKMERPSLKGIFVDNTMDSYFDIQYSNLINTYDQQGMLEAVLRKDAFLSNKIYRLRFVNCEDMFVLRSEGWGSESTNSKSLVFKDRFVHTSTPPVLIITDADDESNVEEIPLILSLGDDFNTEYYFYNESPTWDLIESYDDGTLTTKPITDENSGLTWIWMCIEIFHLLPDIGFVGNVIENNVPGFVVGTDGHNNSHLYPFVYGNEGLPVPLADDSMWYIKAVSAYDGFSLNGGENNYHSKISEIHLIHYNENSEIDYDYPITYDSEFIKITISKNVDWEFKRDIINSPYYAITSMTQFITNALNERGHTQSMMEAFDIDFSENYLNPYEGITGNAVSGVHVDILSDYSDNSVPKKNGIIHDLGAYDGLPTYFKRMKDRTTHRSHVEIYSIRDRINEVTQRTMDKQTAALILDSSMPQDELKDILNSQDPNIVYKPDPNKYIYSSNPDDVISMKNVLSEITFIDENVFGNSNIPAYKNKQKFVYHGNRVFSLGSIYFDPELEIARVYYVNNDPIKYVNNAALPIEDRKAPNTLARICDIPTTYDQLIHIENNCATFLFDDKYVRMRCAFSNEDLNMLLNERTIKLVTAKDNHGPGNKWVLSPLESPDVFLSKSKLIEMGYYKWRVNDSNISIVQDMFEISNGGTNYVDGDTFYFLIGGKAYDGTVTSNTDGRVTGFSLDLSEDEKVSVYNLDGTQTSFVVKTTSSEQGNGLILTLNVDKDIIDDHLPEKLVFEDIAVPPDETLICFKFDTYGNIWLWFMDNNWNWHKHCQVEGLEVIDNPYDMTDDKPERTADVIFMNHILEYQPEINTEIVCDMFSYVDKKQITTYLWNTFPSNPQEDLSNKIENKNKSDVLYELICTNDATGTYDLVTYEYSLPWKNTRNNTTNPCVLPQFNQNNTSSYSNKTNKFIHNFETPSNASQPQLYIYNPRKTIIDDSVETLRDLIIVKDSHTITFKDISTDLVDSSGNLNNNIYYYPEYEFSRDYISTRSEFDSMSRTGLINYIKEKFGLKSEPLSYEGTDYQYTNSELVKYIMDRYPIDKPAYVKDDLKPLEYAGNKVIDGYGEPLGNAPSGGYISLTSERVDFNTIVDGQKKSSFYEYIFMIDDASFTGFNDNFRIFDDNDLDISEMSIVIWQGNRYIFNGENWIALAKSVVNGYFDQSSRLFYYDAQYQNEITPDSDLTYCDTLTGQYYRWTNNKYVLVTI